MHDPGEPLVRVRSNGKHPTALALGHEAVLKDVLVATHQIVHSRKHSLPSGTPLGSQLAQPRAGVIGQRPVWRERVRYRVRHWVEGGVGGAGVEERRQLFAPSDEEPTEDSRGNEHPAKPAELGRGKHAADAHALYPFSDVVQLAGRQRRTPIEEAESLRRLAKPLARLFSGRSERQSPGELATRGPDAPVGEGGERPSPFEIGSCLRRTGMSAKRKQGAARIAPRPARLAPPAAVAHRPIAMREGRPSQPRCFECSAPRLGPPPQARSGETPTAAPASFWCSPRPRPTEGAIWRAPRSHERRPASLAASICATRWTSDATQPCSVTAQSTIPLATMPSPARRRAVRNHLGSPAASWASTTW